MANGRRVSFASATLRPMRTHFIAVLTFVALATSSVALAQAPSVERVRTMLSTYEQGPSQIQWRALGSETVATLQRIYDDHDQPGFMRMRAVAAAAHFPGDATRTFLHRVAEERGQSDLFVRTAIRAMHRAFGNAAADDIRPYLDHQERVVREAAVMAYSTMRLPQVRASLEQRLQVETDDHIRYEIQNALSSMREVH